MKIALGIYEWFCNAVNGNYSNVPSPIVWGAIAGIGAALIIPVVRRKLEAELSHLHAKLDHIILHHPDIPPFEKGAKDVT